MGKTEIARRLARLAQAPFVKVEASKFTEVGYVGRDVESMVRDLVEASISLVREEETEKVRARAREAAEDRLVELLAHGAPPAARGRAPWASAHPPPPPGRLGDAEREKLRAQLRAGTLDDRTVEVDVADAGPTFLRNFSGQGMEEIGVNLSDLFRSMPGMSRTRRRSVHRPRGARAARPGGGRPAGRPGSRQPRGAAPRRVQPASSSSTRSTRSPAARARRAAAAPTSRREGVQRDILPIVEGSTVTTKYGPVKTDHVLFIAAGAFHVSKPSDLIPELQGRFPIRVELEPLRQEDLVRILREPKNSLIRQYTALLETEGVSLHFTDDAVAEVARIAALVNSRTQNIGARRLHTMLERLLDEVSFEASDAARSRDEVIDAAVRAQPAARGRRGRGPLALYSLTDLLSEVPVPHPAVRRPRCRASRCPPRTGR